MANQWVGIWKTQWTGGYDCSAILTITEASDGSITATYTALAPCTSESNGTLTGTISGDGNTYNGTWTQEDGSGDFSFQLHTDGVTGQQTFTGTWGGPGEEPQPNSWNGSKSSTGTTTIPNLESVNYTGNDHFTGEPGGYRRYNAIPVDKNGGAEITDGSFAQVTVYCPLQQVQTTGGTTNLPLGTGQLAGSNYTYPGTNELGVVLFQVDPDGETVYYWNVTSSTQESAETIDLDPNKNIYVTINDTDYANNSGSFNIWVKLIAPQT